jgi:hypothetical protein
MLTPESCVLADEKNNGEERQESNKDNYDKDHKDKAKQRLHGVEKVT